MRDTAAAKKLLFRRLKALHAYESANRALEKARAKNRDVHAVSLKKRFIIYRNNVCMYFMKAYIPIQMSHINRIYLKYV